MKKKDDIEYLYAGKFFSPIYQKAGEIENNITSEKENKKKKINLNKIEAESLKKPDKTIYESLFNSQRQSTMIQKINKIK